MAGKRKQESDLPPRVYAYEGKRRKTYYFISDENKRVNLGHYLDRAIDRYRLLTGHMQEESINDRAQNLWKACKKNASSRKIEFSLTMDEVICMVIRSGWKCEITGIGFNCKKPEGMRIRPWMPSIDRRNSSCGYTSENCRLVCASVNLAMNQFGDNFFIEMMKSSILNNSN